MYTVREQKFCYSKNFKPFGMDTPETLSDNDQFVNEWCLLIGHFDEDGLPRNSMKIMPTKAFDGWFGSLELLLYKLANFALWIVIREQASNRNSESTNLKLLSMVASIAKAFSPISVISNARTGIS